MSKSISERLGITTGLIALTLIIPTLFSMLATSSVTVALPNIAGAFGSTRDEVNWVVTSYMIANGIMLPITGWLESYFGRRNFLKIISIVFALGSAICVLAPSLNILILGRIVQGVGAGPFVPLTQTIFLQTFPKKQHSLAMGIFSIGVITSGILGPAIGGFLVDNVSWQWIFIINIPVGIISATMVHCNIMKNHNKIDTGRFDGVGVTALIIWLLSMQVVLDKGQQYGWFDTRWICWLSGISICSMIFFIVWELEYSNAITNIRILKDKNFVIGTILGSAVNILSYVTLVVLPMYLQSLMGYSAQLSGLSLVSRAVSCMVGILVVAKLVKYIDYRVIIALGFLMLGVSTFAFTSLNLGLSFAYTIAPNVLFGLGLMFTFIPISSLALETLPKIDLAKGAGLHSLSKCIATSFTVSIANTLVSRFSQAHQTYLVGNLTAFNPVFATRLHDLNFKLMHYFTPVIAQKKAYGYFYKQLLVQSKLMAFVDIFAVFALLAFLLIPGSFFLKTNLARKSSE